MESEECDDEACSVGAVRQRAAAAMARCDADAADPNASYARGKIKSARPTPQMHLVNEFVLPI